MLSSPLLLEAALQTAALHGLMVERLHLQPKAFESLRYLSTLRDGEPVIVRARRRPSRRYDVDVEGPQGVVMMLRGLEHFSLRQLDEGEQFEIPEGGWATSAFR